VFIHNLSPFQASRLGDRIFYELVAALSYLTPIIPQLPPKVKKIFPALRKSVTF